MLLKNYTISVRDILFKLNFRTNLTMVMGDSSTGKSLLFEYIKKDAVENNRNFICIDYNSKNLIDIESVIKNSDGKVFFIDNADILLSKALRYYISLDKKNQYIVFNHILDGYRANKNSFAELKIDSKKGYLKYLLD